MNVRKLGEGPAEVSVVACVHGDETAGASAIDRLLAEGPSVRTPAQFIIANEKAKAGGERSIDADLNRSFPGNPASDLHEVALASDLLKEVKDTKVLDIHTTSSAPTPYAFCVNYTLQRLHLIRSTGVDFVVDPTALPNSGGGLVTHCNGVLVECGPKGHPDAVDTASEVLVNFLRANDVLEGDFEYSTDPQLYRIFGRIDHPAAASDLHATNFEIVREGEEFLSVDGEVVVAEQDFYPVLASDDELGAPFVGFKAKNVGPVSDRVIER